MTILVVDDSNTMRMLIRRELRLAGWDDVRDAPDGVSALEILASGDVDLVLSDWNMPAMDGLELLAEIQRRGCHTKFGFVTCESSPELRARALNAGAHFIVTKPAGHEELDRSIRLALGLLEDADGFVGSVEERSIPNVLSGLFQRPVTVSPAPTPGREVPRCVVTYRCTEDARRIARLVAEIPLAAVLGCALGRIPPQEAAEWKGAHNLHGPVEKNFREVANVLAGFASPSGSRYVLDSLEYIGEGVVSDPPSDSESWHTTIRVDVEDYPTGLLAFADATACRADRSAPAPVCRSHARPHQPAALTATGEVAARDLSVA